MAQVQLGQEPESCVDGNPSVYVGTGLGPQGCQESRQALSSLPLRSESAATRRTGGWPWSARKV